MDGDNGVIIVKSDLAQFLTEKGVPSECTQCGHDYNNTFVSPLAKVVDAEIFIFENRSLLDSDGTTAILKYYPVYCDNCGYVRMFNADHISRWILDRDQQKPNGGKDE
ncbi:hypothetical protein ACX1H4_13920 [Yersinia enterocolitica]|uniref:hypothetical protein n=1 Tax=Yersinia enterocolitica TaxID=630 RepID=UPI0027FD98EB|nr:hypothetical protein [Yersinia enterocolitica]EKN3395014.1 hypothetical protein [Yersinia enterocolitica]EKN3597018.1 hypothetical protein [Yersinia enterocolitica]EKN3769464.1 hypothetical protein [Yersinia enterocolitica]EKN3832726.1 hypothetical protein [Yersinia enterocolitica]